jgi:chemotaxis response regulator CheB
MEAVMATICVIDYDSTLALKLQANLRKDGWAVEVDNPVYLEIDAIEPGNADVAMIDTSMAPADVLRVTNAVSRLRPLPLITVSSHDLGPARKSAPRRRRVRQNPRLFAVTRVIVSR